MNLLMSGYNRFGKRVFSEQKTYRSNVSVSKKRKAKKRPISKASRKNNRR